MGEDDQAAPLLEVRGVTLRAGRRELVKDLDLSLGSGEGLVLVGGNGAGKSTLLAVLCGLARPDAGSVRRPDTPPGVLFQDGALWPHMTVEQHLAFVAPGGDVHWRDRLLRTYRLAHLREARPETLSGGERLRLGLARALAPRPAWLLLDEPFAHLDPASAAVVRETLPGLIAELGAASIIVCHDPDDVPLLGDRLLALDGRGGYWIGPSRYALESPPTAELAAFSGRGTILVGLSDHEGFVDFGLGLTLADQPPGASVRAYLDAAAVRVVASGRATLTGTYVASDRRGGSWIRVGEKLLRSSDSRGPLRRGDEVTLRIDGEARPLGAEPGPGR